MAGPLNTWSNEPPGFIRQLPLMLGWCEMRGSDKARVHGNFTAEETQEIQAFLRLGELLGRSIGAGDMHNAEIWERQSKTLFARRGNRSYAAHYQGERPLDGSRK